MGAAILGVFAGLVDGGMSSRQAIQQIAPAIDALQASLTESGLAGQAAFTDLQVMATLAADTIAGPALESVQGFGTALVGLQNAGLLTQQTFVGLTNQIAQTFDSLIAQGVDGDAALRLMQPTLQTIWQLQQDFGYEVDASTQKMLDQAKQAGLVGDAHRSASDKMVEGIERLGDLMEAFLKQMGVDLPKAIEKSSTASDEFGDTFEDAADRATDGLDDVRDGCWVLRDVLDDDLTPASDEFGDTFEDAADRATGGLDDVRDGSWVLRDVLDDDLTPASDEFGDTFEDAADRARGGLNDVRDGSWVLRDVLEGDLTPASHEWGDTLEDAAVRGDVAIQGLTKQTGTWRDAVVFATDAAGNFGHEVTRAAENGASAFRDLENAAGDFGDGVERSANKGVGALLDLVGVAGGVFSTLDQGVTVPLNLIGGWGGFELSGGGGGGQGDGGRAWLTVDEARKAGVEWFPREKSFYSDDAYTEDKIRQKNL